MFVLFLCLSLVIFTFGTVNAVNLKRNEKITWQLFLLLMLVFTTIAMWIAVLPLVDEGDFVYKPLYAIFYALESAVGNVDYSLFSEQFTTTFSFWRIYTILLHLLIPITAFGTILLSFVKVFGWFRYTLFRGDRKIILFSNLSDKNKAYARRIDQKSNLLIFCNTEDVDNEKFDEDNSRDMIFTSQSEIQILKQIHKKNLTIMEMSDDENRNLQKSVEIIHALESNDGEQTRSVLSKFLRKYLPERIIQSKIVRYLSNDLMEEDKKTIHIFTATSQPDAATILDNVMGRGTSEEPLGFRQTIINEYKRISFQLLYEEPLYKLVSNRIDPEGTARPTDKSETLDIMIVGFGHTGQEVLKVISWTGCFPNTDTNIHVISRDAVENGKKLLADCPELGVDLRHNGGFLSVENGIQLNKNAPIYYYDAITESCEFEDIVRGLVHCRYIVISLGDDSVSLAAAFRIYRLLMKERYLHNQKIDIPEIHVQIRDDENLQFFSSEEDRAIFSCFKMFGHNKDIYSEKQVGHTNLDKLAIKIHGIYLGEQDRNNEKNDYSYLPESKKDANLAAALHIGYKLHFIPGLAFEEISGQISDEKLKDINNESQRVFNAMASPAVCEEIANWEHIRWQAYMRTEGYMYCPYEQTEKLFREFDDGDWKNAVRKTRSALREARIHPCIGDSTDHLQKISRLIGDPEDPFYFQKIDQSFVNDIPKIVSDIYKIIPAEGSAGK